MLTIAIYSSDNNSISIIKSIIQDFLIENKLMGRVSYFQKEEDMILASIKYDIYIIDMDNQENTISLGKMMMEKDVGTKLVYISENTNNAFPVFKLHADYFLEKPIEQNEFYSILTIIRQKIQEDSIIIKTPTGERRVRANNLNYINIVKRCLCYHLKDGAMFDGQTLRTSFEKAIYPLQYHKSKAFLFLPPSLLINLNEVKMVNADHAIFENDDIVYFPKKSYDVVRDAWINCNNIIN